MELFRNSEFGGHSFKIKILGLIQCSHSKESCGPLVVTRSCGCLWEGKSPQIKPLGSLWGGWVGCCKRLRWQQQGACFALPQIHFQKDVMTFPAADGNPNIWRAWGQQVPGMYPGFSVPPVCFQYCVGHGAHVQLGTFSCFCKRPH